MNKGGLVFFISFIAFAAILYFVEPFGNDEEEFKELEAIVNYGLEAAYFEGQKDAIEGDIRIELGEDSIYVWSKSPWDNGNEPAFIPGEEFNIRTTN